MPHRPVVVPAVLVVLALLIGALAPPAGAATDEPPVVAYRPPVDGPIVDRFDPPPRRWQPGNRGVDYGVAAGTVVVAAGTGEVVFAGAVADTLHVTVRHADGLRTSYSFLAEVRVHVGQQVRVGQPVGVAVGAVHVGVRTPDGTYLDPEALFAGVLEPRVRLVPGAEDGLDPLDERRSLLETLFDTGAGAAAQLREVGSDWLQLVAHYAAELDPVVHLQRAGDALQDWIDQLFDCTPASTPPPAPTGRRIVVLVSGLGTDSGDNSAWHVDTAGLGYAGADVVRFSYQGGQAPPAEPGSPPADGAVSLVTRSDPGLSGIPVHEFSRRDSQQSLATSAERLGELLGQAAAAEPGVPIDVIAHSQGGVVARLGILGAGERGTLPSTVENLVTIGSPHQGAPLATALLGVQQTETGRDALGKLRGRWPFEDLDDRLPAMTELSETSSVGSGMRDASIPDGVRFTSLGASGDVVVPGTATDDPEADVHRLIPTPISLDAHGDLAEMPATTREIRLAVAGAGPTCQSFGAAVSTFVEAETIRSGESVIGADLVATGATAESVRRGLDPLGVIGD